MVSKKAFAWENFTTLGLCLLVLAGLSACGSSSGSNSPGSGTSGTGGNPLPSISSLSPASATAGTAGFTLTVTGTGFISTSAVEWNGSARTTSFVSNTELQADISTSDIATGGSATVTVTSPPPGGGISGGSKFTIAEFAACTTLTTVSQAANDLVWDPVNQVIYLSVPSAASANGNTISILNPSTGVIASSTFAGSSPDVLALSAGSQYLYVALDGSSAVQRFTLPGLALDVNYSLGADSFFGPYVAWIFKLLRRMPVRRR